MSGAVSSRLLSAALSDVGRTRSENQDRCALFNTKSGSLVAVVADGMGGHIGGSTASQLAVAAIHEHLSASEDAQEATLAQAIALANERVYAHAVEHSELRGMGTTCVALLIHANGRAWVAHVGDSRAYRLRGGRLEPLTQDHSTVAELVRAGHLTPEEAETDPRRNEILRSVGVAADVEVEVSAVTLHVGDRFVLCSDGLTGPVAEDEVAFLLASHEPEEAARQMIERANANGGPDNVTAIAIDYPDPNAITGTLPIPTSALEADVDDQLRARRRRIVKIGLAAAIVALALTSAILALIMTARVETSPPVTPATGEDTRAG